MELNEKIKLATDDETLNKYGLLVSHSFLNDDAKKSYFDAIEERRKQLFLIGDSLVEIDMEGYNTSKSDERISSGYRSSAY
ncbi:hypothetical protein [Sulfurimonas sp.]|uniref:hypothetical protein n=1 Tax=Sulfurimonas sp. TaxID=2022749 RepID=UPI002605A322|nr:hypothetical protein [Sulfurimonas sp.]MDD3450952.1 hypothetical protein [Sulfurimonas sp.]